jgi:hypothetical protein
VGALPVGVQLAMIRIENVIGGLGKFLASIAETTARSDG